MQEMNLNDVQAELFKRAEAASLRGDGEGAFVFAENRGRAIEISRSQSQWWVEFWENSTDEDAPPIREEFFASVVDAVEEIAAWLYL